MAIDEETLRQLEYAQRICDEGRNGARIIDKLADKDESYKIAQKITNVVNKSKADAATVMVSLVYVVSSLIASFDVEHPEAAIPHELQVAAFVDLLTCALTGAAPQKVIN